MTSEKIRAVAEQARAHLSRIILEEMRDPGLGLITLTDVEMSPDLRYADVYVSVFGSDEDMEKTMRALERAGGFLRSRLGSHLELRRVPELRFHPDKTAARAEKIEKAIERIHRKNDDGSGSQD